MESFSSPEVLAAPPSISGSSHANSPNANGMSNGGGGGGAHSVISDHHSIASSHTPTPTGDINNNNHTTPPPVTTSGNSESRPVPPPTVPAACLNCGGRLGPPPCTQRGKHLKCDGSNPCSRCTSSNSECIYVASRRGYKGPRRNTAANPNKRHASSSPPSSVTDTCPMMGGTPVATPLSTFNPAIVLPEAASPNSPFAAGNINTASNLQIYRNPFANGNNLDALSNPNIGNPIRVQTVADRCFDSFFHHFHACHPFVLPREYLIRLAKDGTIDHLVAAVRFVGSLYIDIGSSRSVFLEEAVRLAYAPNCPKDGFLVQMLLLLTVGLDGSCQQERARQLLADAERAAVDIALNTRQFATVHGRGNAVLEESWRRTWWELYVVDGMIAGVHRATNFLLFDIHADVALPCEEHQYLSGNIPPPMTLEEFDDQLFSGEDREFSSYTYRIAAARNLGRFMRLPTISFPNDENISRVENLLTNWRMHLPPTKRDDLNKNCQLDEMMFQAHFITHATSVLLHQPHSQLDSAPAQSVTSCAPHRIIPSGDAFNTHTRHTITSACEISKMVTQAVPILSHTHFFTCVVTLSSIVHLSKWALYFIQDEEDLRQQIRLNIGALNKLSEVWRSAGTASKQVKGVAQDIYKAKKTQQINPAFWVGFTQEEVINSIAADEHIMDEFNLLAQ